MFYYTCFSKNRSIADVAFLDVLFGHSAFPEKKLYLPNADGFNTIIFPVQMTIYWGSSLYVRASLILRQTYIILSVSYTSIRSIDIQFIALYHVASLFVTIRWLFSTSKV